jgi:hypothetical protein
VPIGSYGQNQALRAHVWAKNGPETSGKGSKKLAKPENATIVGKSKRTQAGPKRPFRPTRRTYGMPKLVPIGSYGKNQALRAHLWAVNGPKTAEVRPDSVYRDRIGIRTRPSYPDTETRRSTAVYLFFRFSRKIKTKKSPAMADS